MIDKYWNLREKPIDIVYLWVDSRDTNWQAKKDRFRPIQNRNDNANSPCRFRSNDELKYSLRSLEKFANWINNIYIVTDNQIPKWLDIENPKITIVDHTEILPKAALPTFNSEAIETCICNISNLSEFFLYANDDCFFCDYVTPEFFYSEEEFPICRFGKKINKKKRKLNLHRIAILNAQYLIKKKFNKTFEFGMHHNIDAYKKSQIIECNKIFSNEINRTMYSRFRDINCVSRIIYSYYACVKNETNVKFVRKINPKLPLYKRIYKLILKKYDKETLLISGSYKKDYFRLLKKYKPKLFCLNDDEKTDELQLYKNKIFLETLFPCKSKFEK